MERLFISGKDEAKARQYLKDIGEYDTVVSVAIEEVFGTNYPKNDGLLMIIAANEIIKANKK